MSLRCQQRCSSIKPSVWVYACISYYMYPCIYNYIYMCVYLYSIYIHVMLFGEVATRLSLGPRSCTQRRMGGPQTSVSSVPAFASVIYSSVSPFLFIPLAASRSLCGSLCTRIAGFAYRTSSVSCCLFRADGILCLHGQSPIGVSSSDREFLWGGRGPTLCVSSVPSPREKT